MCLPPHRGVSSNTLGRVERVAIKGSFGAAVVIIEISNPHVSATGNWDWLLSPPCVPSPLLPSCAWGDCQAQLLPPQLGSCHPVLPQPLLALSGTSGLALSSYLTLGPVSTTSTLDRTLPDPLVTPRESPIHSNPTFILLSPQAGRLLQNADSKIKSAHV